MFPELAISDELQEDKRREEEKKGPTVHSAASDHLNYSNQLQKCDTKLLFLEETNVHIVW